VVEDAFTMQARETQTADREPAGEECEEIKWQRAEARQVKREATAAFGRRPPAQR
jgi:hypothetical protein